MKRKQSINDFNVVNFPELCRKTAIHEAGHAAAIYLGNQQRMLPPVFFQVIINSCPCNADQCMTKIEGGRLIHTLPSFLDEVTRNFSLAHQQTYRLAFEADIVNLLAGSLAEAHYVAKRDNELISPHLVPLNVLHNYGGTADLEAVQQYLDCFISDKAEQKQKVKELFWQAFEFVNHWQHWYAITALANHLMLVQRQRNVMYYDEIAHILDTHFALAQQYNQRTIMF